MIVQKASVGALVLSQVPVTASMAHVISFEGLVSLTLRRCPGWDTFLARAVQLKSRIKLATLNLKTQTVYLVVDPGHPRRIFGAFRGLEELFMSQAGPFESFALWNCIACHQSTLTRFVQQQRAIMEMAAPYFEQAYHI